MYYLEKRNELGEVAAYFGPEADSVLNTLSDYDQLDGLKRLVGLDFNQALANSAISSYYSFRVRSKMASVVKGFDYNIRYVYTSYNPEKPVFWLDGRTIRISLNTKSGMLTLKDEKGEQVQFNLLLHFKEYLNSKERDNRLELPKNKMILVQESRHYRVKVLLHVLEFSTGNKGNEVQDIESDILIKVK